MDNPNFVGAQMMDFEARAACSFDVEPKTARKEGKGVSCTCLRFPRALHVYVRVLWGRGSTTTLDGERQRCDSLASRVLFATLRRCET